MKRRIVVTDVETDEVIIETEHYTQTELVFKGYPQLMQAVMEHFDCEVTDLDMSVNPEDKRCLRIMLRGQQVAQGILLRGGEHPLDRLIS